MTEQTTLPGAAAEPSPSAPADAKHIEEDTAAAGDTAAVAPVASSEEAEAANGSSSTVVPGADDTVISLPSSEMPKEDEETMDDVSLGGASEVNLARAGGVGTAGLGQGEGQTSTDDAPADQEIDLS